jgi:hypothetical protein
MRPTPAQQGLELLQQVVIVLALHRKVLHRRACEFPRAYTKPTLSGADGATGFAYLVHVPLQQSVLRPGERIAPLKSI